MTVASLEESSRTTVTLLLPQSHTTKSDAMRRFAFIWVLETNPRWTWARRALAVMTRQQSLERLTIHQEDLLVELIEQEDNVNRLPHHSLAPNQVQGQYQECARNT